MRLITGLALLGVAGCRKDPGGEGAYGALAEADVTITSEGAGPENELPLEPMLPGFEARASGVAVRWSATLDAGRDDVTMSELVSDGVGFSPTASTAYGDEIGVLRKTGDGVVLYTTNDHLAADDVPVLLVPEKVRVGMAWESVREDGSMLALSVIAHEEALLSIGPVDVWGIQDAANEQVRWYAEGIGRLTGPTQGTSFDPGLAYTDFIVPAAAQPGVEAALDPAELRPLLDPFGQLYELQAPVMIGLSSTVREDGWWLYTHGYLPSPCITCDDAPADYCVRMGPFLERYVGGEHDACPILTWDFNGDVYPYTILSANSLLPGHTFALPDDTEPRVGIAAAGEGGSDGERLYTWNTPDGVRCLNANLSVWTSTDAPCDTLPLNMNGAPNQLVDESERRMMFMMGDNQLRGVQFIGPISTPSADAPLHLAAIDTVGRVFRLSVEGGRIHGFVPVGVISGQRTVYVTDEAREGWSITRDGRIFRVRVDPVTGEVAIDSLGDVDVDDDSGRYVPVGVAPDPNVPGDVIVAVAGEALDTNQNGVADFLPKYKNTLHRATLTREPVPLETPPSLLVGARGEMGGRLVCWPETDAPFDPSGWLVGGEPPLRILDGVGPDGNCALLETDGTPDPAYAEAPHAITANIPGVGIVRLGTGNPGGFETHIGTPAILRDGTLVDNDGFRFDEHGIYVGTSGSVTGLADWPADVGGYGQWLFTNTTTHTIVHNLGGGIPPIDCGYSSDLGGSCGWYGAVEGGGILLQYDDGHIDVVRPDGITALPEYQASGVGGGTLLLDGRMCAPRGGATEPMSVTCRSPDLVDEVTNALDGVPYGALSMYPIPGGYLIYREFETVTYFFDPVAMTLSVLADRGVVDPIRAADGAVFALAYDGVDYEVVTITAAGLAPVPGDFPVEGVNGVIPLADEILVRGYRWHRIPR